MPIFDYKKLKKEELEEIFKDVRFKIPPMQHQLISLAFAAEKNRVAFFHGVGTRKTLTSLWSAQLWDCRKMLVVAPSSAFSAWERDINQYTDYNFEFLLGSGRERQAKLKKKKDIFVVNYEGLKTIYANLMKGRGWKINYTSFIHNFDCLILDEIHKCKNYSSLQSNICLELSKKAKHVIGLTGTAIDNSLLEAFNIYKVIDLGKTLGTNFVMYRNRFFKPSFFNWELKKGAEEEILKMMSKTTLSFDRTECFDLPEIQEIVRTVEPSDEFTSLQLKIVNGETINLNGTIIKLRTDNEEHDLIVRSNFLRELPCGFLYYKDESGVKQTYRLKKNAKLESLIDILEDTSGKVIIFFNFTEEGNLIQETLKKEKHNFICIHGGQDTLERIELVKKFTNDKSIKCAVVQQTAGAEGWDGKADRKSVV
jgi:SWI/SNF-related matrix-associated actin-dependent regulator 1 of chromatin subfamily A